MHTFIHFLHRHSFSFIALAVVALATSSGCAQEFSHTTTASNTIASRSTISAPGLANNPQAIIVATPTSETARANPHPIGAWYYNGKWNVFNTDHANLAPGLVFKIQVFAEPGPDQFLHIVTRDSLSEAASYIDNPSINGNPSVHLIILQNHAPDTRSFSLNANEARATYNAASGKWYIANVNGKALYPNTAYNIVVARGGTNDDSIRPVREPSGRPIPVPTGTGERREVPPTVQPVAPRSAVSPQPLAQSSTSPQGSSTCTNEMAWQTVGKWGRQRKDDLAMADSTFPKAQYKAVLEKAQEVIEIFKIANPEFRGIEAHAYRGIRGQPPVPNGPVPFRVDVGYGSFICVGNDTASVDKRGKIILYGSYGTTTVMFNGLSDILESVQGGAPLLTTDGEEIFQYNKDLGEFRAWPMIQTSHRDSYHEAVIIGRDERLPFKPVTREQYIRARIKMYESGTGMREAITGLNRVLQNMSPSERQSPALVRDVTTLPGGSRLFASEAEGGRHLVTIDRSYFDPKLPRDAIQLITVHWHSSPGDRPKVEMLEAFKSNFDFLSLSEMIGH